MNVLTVQIYSVNLVWLKRMVNRNVLSVQNPLVLIKSPKHVSAHQNRDLIQTKLIVNHAKLIFVKLVPIILPLVTFANKALIFRIMLVSVIREVQIAMVNANHVK